VSIIAVDYIYYDVVKHRLE